MINTFFDEKGLFRIQIDIRLMVQKSGQPVDMVDIPLFIWKLTEQLFGGNWLFIGTGIQISKVWIPDEAVTIVCSCQPHLSPLFCWVI